MKGVDRDIFILKNMGLVKMAVNKYKHRIYNISFVDIEDLKSIGTIGLIKAYDRFDPSYKVKFSTYAVPMIEGEIRRYLRDDIDPIHFTRRAKIHCGRIVEADLLNEEPSVIAEKLGISIDDVRDALDYYNIRSTYSFDAEVYEDERTPVTLADMTGFDVDFDSNLEIELLLNKLDKKTRKIVELKLQDFSQVEIGKIIGVSQATVSRKLSELREKIYREEISLTDKNEVCNKADYSLAKKLAGETSLKPTDIRKQTGVCYETALNYVKKHRTSKQNKEKKEVPEKTVEHIA